MGDAADGPVDAVALQAAGTASFAQVEQMPLDAQHGWKRDSMDKGKVAWTGCGRSSSAWSRSSPGGTCFPARKPPAVVDHDLRRLRCCAWQLGSAPRTSSGFRGSTPRLRPGIAHPQNKCSAPVAHSFAACCSSARLAASHCSLEAVSASRAAFQHIVQSLPSSQRANPARRSAGRSDRSWTTSWPQAWVTFHCVRDRGELRWMRDPELVELVFCGFMPSISLRS